MPNDPAIAAETERFVTAVEQNPSDASLWVSFARFQRMVPVLFPEAGCNGDTAREEAKGVLESALQLLPNGSKLWNEYIMLQCDGLQLKQQRVIWKTVLEVPMQASCFAELSLKYLRFLLERDDKVTWSEVQHHFMCLIKEGLPEASLLDVLLSYCVIAVRFGYTHRAICTLEAILEFNLFDPSSKMEGGSRCEMFESIWRSYRHMADPKFQPWSSFVDKEMPRQRGPMIHERYELWIEHERNSEPYDSVVFSEMKPWLQPLHSYSNRIAIALALVALEGAPPLLIQKTFLAELKQYPALSRNSLFVLH